MAQPHFQQVDDPGDSSAEAIVRGLSLALDGVRDSIAEVEEDIEADQATMARYQRAALEERFGVRILDPQALSQPRNSSRSQKGKQRVERRISSSSPEATRRVKEWAEREGCDSDGDRASDEENASGSSPHPSSPAINLHRDRSPFNMTAESDCEIGTSDVEEQSSPVSSTGLTNTSDEYSE
jgi:hypothetical protein